MMHHEAGCECSRCSSPSRAPTREHAPGHGLDADVTEGGRALGYDIAITLEPGRVRFAAAVVRMHGEQTLVAEHTYEIAPSSTVRIATAALTMVDGVPRLLVIEETEGEPVAPHLALPPIQGVVATLWIPAERDTPARVRRAVVTPAPPMELAVQGGPVLPVLRPDLAPENERRIRAARALSTIHREAERRRRAPMPASDMTRDGLDALTLLIAQIHGMVEP
jgi:hypothetical protein